MSKCRMAANYTRAERSLTMRVVTINKWLLAVPTFESYRNSTVEFYRGKRHTRCVVQRSISFFPSEQGAWDIFLQGGVREETTGVLSRVRRGGIHEGARPESTKDKVPETEQEQSSPRVTSATRDSFAKPRSVEKSFQTRVTPFARTN